MKGTKKELCYNRPFPTTIDEKRIYSAGYKEKPEIKQSRKKYKRQREKKADAFVHQEGVQYQSQGFYEDNTETAPVRSQKKRRKESNCSRLVESRATGEGDFVEK